MASWPSYAWLCSGLILANLMVLSAIVLVATSPSSSRRRRIKVSTNISIRLAGMLSNGGSSGKGEGVDTTAGFSTAAFEKIDLSVSDQLVVAVDAKGKIVAIHTGDHEHVLAF